MWTWSEVRYIIQKTIDYTHVPEVRAAVRLEAHFYEPYCSEAQVMYLHRDGVYAGKRAPRAHKHAYSFFYKIVHDREN